MLFWGPIEVESIKCLKPYPGYFDHYIAPTIGQQFLWSVMIEKVSIKRLDLYNLNMRQRENVLNNKSLGGAQYIYGDSDYIDLTERTDYFENRQQVGHNCSGIFTYLFDSCLFAQNCTYSKMIHVFYFFFPVFSHHLSLSYSVFIFLYSAMISTGQKLNKFQ